MRFVIICIILIELLLSVSFVESITVPSDNNIPNIPKDLKEFAYGSQSAITHQPAEDNNGQNTGERIQYVQVPDTPVLITKSLIPLNYNYFVGDVVGVFVEIKNMGRTLKHIDIKESASDGLEIINISKKGYILHTLDEVSSYENRLNKNYYSDSYDKKDERIHNIDVLNINIDCGKFLFNYKNFTGFSKNFEQFLKKDLEINWSSFEVNNSISGTNIGICDPNDSSKMIIIYLDKDDTFGRLCLNGSVYKFKVKSGNVYKLDNDFDISIPELGPKERVAYWYFIKLHKPGYFGLSTTFRYWFEDNSNFLDIDKVSTIKANIPVPIVDVDINKLHLLKNELARITYKIKYLRRPIEDSVRIELANKSYFTISAKDSPNIYIYPNDFKIGQSFDKAIDAYYANDGEYSIPEIIINGNNYSFTREKVYVETRFQRYADLVTLIFAIILFLIGDLSVKLREPKTNKIKSLSSILRRSNGKVAQIKKFYLLDSLAFGLILLLSIVTILYFVTDISGYWLLAILIICILGLFYFLLKK